MPAMQLTVGFLLVATFGHAQNVTDVLSSQSELSEVVSLLTGFPQFSAQLNGSEDFTFLVPSNDAIRAWLNQSSPSNSTIGATLKYHLLDTTLPSASLNEGPSWYFSALNDSAYTNLTGPGLGQLVEVPGDPIGTFISGNKSESHILIADLICAGGIIHMIDNVLEIPLDLTVEATAANLQDFIALLAIDNFTIAEEIRTEPNTTVLAPNSNVALNLAYYNDTFDSIYGMNNSIMDKLFNYHVLDSLIFSPEFENGTSLQTKAGINILVTVDEAGDIWVNQAKVTGRDYLIANGVMHVIDDILQPYNVSRPSLTVQSNNSTSPNITSPAPLPITPLPSPQPPPGLSTGAKAGIGVGVAVAGLAIIAAIISFCFRRLRSSSSSTADAIGTEKYGQPAELGSEGREKYPQLDSMQRLAEMDSVHRHELD
ncbi:MAG: hypothetical protein M1821_000632 [Bathelium mastoideum]|nr:MAG: hypothetical protein M1821_000632 [Bathelium mastoideum]